MNWLLNNPVVFTLIILAVVLIAVGLILYFLVFNTKIEAKLAERKKSAIAKRESDAKSKELVSDVFKERHIEENKAPENTEKEVNETLKTLTSDSRKEMLNAQNLKSQVKKKEPAKKGDEKDVNDIGDVISTMNQFKKK